MRDITGKIEDFGATPDGRFAAVESNDVWEDILAEVTRSGQEADAADKTQMSEASTLAAFRASAFTVDGSSTANSIILVCRSGATGHRVPTTPGPGPVSVYNRYDGATINFTPTLSNTGPVTIDIGQTVGTLIGSKKLFDSSGSPLGAGDIVANNRVVCQFDITADGGAGAWLLTTAAFIQSDWGQTNPGQPDYIQNKPGTPTETVAGLPEVATQAETDAGTDDTVMITPKKLKAAIWTYNAGDIIERLNTVSPTGHFLECNGQAVNRTTYADLFAVISTKFGIGDGSTTFNLPNIPRKFQTLSTNSFVDLSEPFTGSIRDCSINTGLSDVYACATNEARKWIKTSGTWASLTPPAGTWVGIAYDEFNDRIWMVDNVGQNIYYTAVSPISWVNVGAAPSISYLGLAINGANGYVYAFSTSAVYESAPGYTTWTLLTTPGSNYRAMCVDRATSDVYLGQLDGTIYRRDVGLGTFNQRPSVNTTALNALAINASTRDLYAMSTLTIFVQLGADGVFQTLSSAPSAGEGIDVNYIDGSTAYVETNFAARRPETTISSYIAY